MAADGKALLADLQRLAEEARPLQEKALRASADNLAGYIETVALDDAGRVWVMGWIRHGLPTEFPVVLADRRRHAGGMAVFCFPRADLPQDGHAFIGLVASDWKPTPGVDLYCFPAPGLSLFLRGVKPLAVVDSRVISEHIAHALPAASAGRGKALQSLLQRAGDWSPHSPRAGFAMKASVDRLLVLPGFGAFAEGWVLSPSKPVIDFSVRLGGKVLRGVPGSLVRRARPDISVVGGHTPLLLERAGFTVALEGELTSADLLDPLLKAHFADESSANVPVDPETVRRIGHAVPVDDVLLCYPGLAEESFFPRFAAALRQDLVASLAQVALIAPPAPALRLVVAAMPAHPSDARLLVEELALALRRCATPPAVLLLADGGTSRAELPVLARTLAEASGQRCGIALVEQADRPLWALPEVLRAAGSLHFLLLAQHAFPCRAGWDAALASLAGPEEAPQALRHAGPGGLAALRWTRAGLQHWLGHHSPALGQAHADALLAQATPLPGSALSALAGQGGGRVLAAVDRLDATRPTLTAPAPAAAPLAAAPLATPAKAAELATA